MLDELEQLRQEGWDIKIRAWHDREIPKSFRPDFGLVNIVLGNPIIDSTKGGIAIKTEGNSLEEAIQKALDELREYKSSEAYQRALQDLPISEKPPWGNYVERLTAQDA